MCIPCVSIWCKICQTFSVGRRKTTTGQVEARHPMVSRAWKPHEPSNLEMFMECTFCWCEIKFPDFSIWLICFWHIRFPLTCMMISQGFLASKWWGVHSELAWRLMGSASNMQHVGPTLTFSIALDHVPFRDIMKIRSPQKGLLEKSAIEWMVYCSWCSWEFGLMTCSKKKKDIRRMDVVVKCILQLYAITDVYTYGCFQK